MLNSDATIRTKIGTQESGNQNFIEEHLLVTVFFLTKCLGSWLRQHAVWKWDSARASASKPCFCIDNSHCDKKSSGRQLFGNHATAGRQSNRRLWTRYELWASDVDSTGIDYFAGQPIQHARRGDARFYDVSYEGES